MVLVGAPVGITTQVLGVIFTGQFPNIAEGCLRSVLISALPHNLGGKGKPPGASAMSGE